MNEGKWKYLSNIYICIPETTNAISAPRGSLDHWQYLGFLSCVCRETSRDLHKQHQENKHEYHNPNNIFKSSQQNRNTKTNSKKSVVITIRYLEIK